ncbi:proteasome-domain-containing protein [Rozella allomycis CSF55]|uniref:Proteasome subunit beta n=1 Tax=Rozella allomycis (strain CSF55) TaxID=988480 RepID=A0A075B4X1_ROZAC|nr:putative proteasome subunit beta type-3 [Rozella allomycis CSF55]RKP19120.1 proteasome-domain-containing protein [Rozella allomycis CSF55]|eukprot:EPZ36546.1 putative proteasome subunit beta type-3 [Rozella allomycis CSF55]
MQYNGGAVVAMKGKGCVAIASDKRLGQQALTVSTEFPKVFPIHDKLYLGLSGLATDVITLSETFRYKVNMYSLNHERDIEPVTFANMVSSTLYEKRFGPYYCEPIVAGLNSKTNEPFICSMDVIGCINFAKDFVVGGTCGPNLYGMCESLYEPDLEPEELFEIVSQALVNAVDRDALSGWGAVVYIITADKVITRTLKCRQD